MALPTRQFGQIDSWLTQANLRLFFDLLRNGGLSAVFQPVLDLRLHCHLGYEGLIRGPADTPLHAPQVLLGLAQESGLTMEFERLCRQTVLEQFARTRLPGSLFINVSVSCLADPRFLNGETANLLKDLQLDPGRIIIEITENQGVADFSALHEILAYYRNQGYRIAIDDLGEGFSNLRMWSEIRPEFIKIDQHFVRGIDADPLKFSLVQAMRDIAESSHATLIAEGIETKEELATLHSLGIHCGQGYLIALPAPVPHRQPDTRIIEMLGNGNFSTFRQQKVNSDITVRQLLQKVEAVSPERPNEDVFDYFERHPECHALPVVRPDGTPLGIINRYSLVDRFARPFRREIYGKRPCTQFMNTDPICADHALPAHKLGQMFSRAEHHQLIDGFIITENNRYLGIGSSQTLMGLITELQIRAARHANPLTQLPGNVPIYEHIDCLLGNAAEFVACYCDIDHFKPFNDTYGYRQGDQIIQALGNILKNHCNPHHDFVGHIGGDDFVILLQDTAWEHKCQAILAGFTATLPAFIGSDHLRQGGYFAEDRRGNRIRHPLPALSIGALIVEPNRYCSHHEVAGAMSLAKKEAKKIQGNSLFIERRQPGPPPADDAATRPDPDT